MAGTTQTGIPITDCTDCGGTHPVTRQHCTGCGAASAFLSDRLCLRCRSLPPAGEADGTVRTHPAHIPVSAQADATQLRRANP